MKDGKPTGGYDRLKIKYEEVQQAHKALENDYLLLREHFKDLESTLKVREELIKAQSRRLGEYWKHMGWLRRWTWVLKTKI